MFRLLNAALLGLLIATFLSGANPLHAAPLDDRLTAAAERGDIDAVRQALRDGAALEACDEQRRTALMAAVQHNRVAVAEALIAAGADVNAKDAIEDSPYLLAGARGYLEILRLTLAHGADLKSTNRFGGTALIPAAMWRPCTR